MEKPLVECVMNVSEGRSQPVLDAIASSIESVSGALLLDRSADEDHHRAVFTFAGSPRPALRAAWKAIEKAVELIDLRRHRGVHPRLGAADVVPFVALRDVSLQEMIDLARQLGREVAARLAVPVYLYEHAAFNPERRNLAVIRKGGLEKLREEIGRDPARRPDFGPARVHPTAGVTVIGVRDSLIAFNVYLKSSDVKLARSIAAQIRERDGGFPGLKALGFYIARRDRAQVSMNLTDLRRTSLKAVFDRICELAEQRQTAVEGSEIIGLVPRAALPDGSAEHLRLESFHPGLILENRIEALIDPKQG